MSMSIREKYNIPQEAKVLLYVGNISQNKNQEQMVRVYALLPDELRKQTYVLFCGEDHSKDGALEKAIASTPEANSLVLCGGVNKEQMPDYYKEADGVVLLSFAEGFGLSLIEGMHFGLPCAMPSDLDAFEDIYDEKVVVAVKSRSDNDVADAVVELLTRKWNKESIKTYSKKFESGEMARKYIDEYNKIVQY